MGEEGFLNCYKEHLKNAFENKNLYTNIEYKEYKKTLFVFYGDHAAQLGRKEYAKYINFDYETGEIKDKNLIL